MGAQGQGCRQPQGLPYPRLHSRTTSLSLGGQETPRWLADLGQETEGLQHAGNCNRYPTDLSILCVHDVFQELSKHLGQTRP